MTTTLYVMRDAGGCVIYVGISGHATRRLDEHRLERHWWRDIASIDLSHFDTWVEAIEAESDLIRTLRPLHNVALNPDRPVERRRSAPSVPDDDPDPIYLDAAADDLADSESLPPIREWEPCSLD